VEPNGGNVKHCWRMSFGVDKVRVVELILNVYSHHCTSLQRNIQTENLVRLDLFIRDCVERVVAVGSRNFHLSQQQATKGKNPDFTFTQTHYHLAPLREEKTSDKTGCSCRWLWGKNFTMELQ